MVNIVFDEEYTFDLMMVMVSLISFGTTSPRYSIQQAMYFPKRGSHFIMQLSGSKQSAVICRTELFSCKDFSFACSGEYATNGKCIRGNGTKFV